MKKSTLRRLMVLALCLTLVTCTLVGGTLAKYTTTVSGTASVNVAKFGFSIKDGSGENDTAYTKTSAATIDIFNQTTTEHVVDTVIAPGSEGKFDIVVDASASEVDVAFTAKVTETNGGANKNLTMKYAVGNKPNNDSGYIALGTGENQLDKALTTALGTYLESETNAKTVTVYWKWIDEGSVDANHTELGESSSNVQYSLNIEITGTQVTPATPTTPAA